MRIALISCTSKKKGYKCKAAELYSESARFVLAYEYAKKTCDEVYILSAKYGLISEYEVIEPYNETLRDKSKADRKAWSLNVLVSIQKKFSLDNDEYLILAGNVYIEYLLPYLDKYELPLKGQRIGNWIPVLRSLLGKDRIDSEENDCHIIHSIFNGMQRLSWHDINTIPFSNGIYIMFETGEKYAGMDRIVRIGTHRADNNLKERLRDHFVRRNADGSIFRKNIGRAILHKSNDPYEAVWELNTSNAAVLEANTELIDIDYENEIETIISNYLQSHISFVCFEVDTKAERLRLEEGLIALLNNSAGYYSSQSWLGRYSPKAEIVNSGLWNVQGLNGIPLTKKEIEKIKCIVEGVHKASISHSNMSINIDEKMKERSNEQVKKNFISAVPGNLTIRVGTAEIKGFIAEFLEKSREKGKDYVDIVSGDIHREMKLRNKMPSVCSAMYQMMKSNDEILSATPSGKSSTIKIRYYL